MAMPAPRLDSALMEYLFSAEESRAARILDQMKILWIQTKYARLMKEKASLLIPKKMDMDNRDFIAEVAEIDGKLNMLQELLTEHQQAISEASQPQTVAASGEENLAARAAAYVHKPS